MTRRSYASHCPLAYQKLSRQPSPNSSVLSLAHVAPVVPGHPLSDHVTAPPADRDSVQPVPSPPPPAAPNPTATLAEQALLSQRFTGHKTSLPFVACAQKTAILRRQTWSPHETEVVGIEVKECMTECYAIGYDTKQIPSRRSGST
jgi:hypothetical protein